MATIGDVAKRAKVSRSTVSRVLNGQKVHIRESTRKAVLQAIEELDYQPNSLAQSLKTKKSKTIGIITNNIASEFVSLMMRGIERHAFSCGYTSLICGGGEELEKQKLYLDILSRRQVDGVIVASSSVEKVTEELVLEGTPIVYAYSYSPYPTHTSVLPDDRRAAFEAVEYLIRLGHRRIAFVNGDEGTFPALDRLRGYQNACDRHGVDLDPRRIVHLTWMDTAGSEKVVEELLSLPSPPTAIFAATDLLAAGAVDAIKKRGLRVPEDVSVVGFDGRELASFVRPPLTTMRLPMEEIGRVAAESLVGILERKAEGGETLFIPCELLVRQSSGPAPRLAREKPGS